MRMTQVQFFALPFIRACVSDEGCWIWQGSLDPSGYGRVGFAGKVRYVHRVAYELCIGKIRPGLEIDHLCRNRACCNPEHLETVTRRENLMRGDTLAAQNAAKTHCPRDHEYTPANTWTSKKGKRFCRACRYINLKAYRDRQKIANS